MRLRWPWPGRPYGEPRCRSRGNRCGNFRYVLERAFPDPTERKLIAGGNMARILTDRRQVASALAVGEPGGQVPDVCQQRAQRLALLAEHVRRGRRSREQQHTDPFAQPGRLPRQMGHGHVELLVARDVDLVQGEEHLHESVDHLLDDAGGKLSGQNSAAVR